jgi:hypothetical protein
MRRRTLLGGALAALAAVFVAPVTRACAATPTAEKAAAPSGGSGNATLWEWKALPNSGGLQIHCTAANGRTAKVPVTWTADGVVTADYPSRPITVTAPAAADGTTHVASNGPYGLTVRRT